MKQSSTLQLHTTRTGNMWMAAALCALLHAGCDIDDTLYNTPHPDMGSVVVSAFVSQHSSDALPPDNFTFSMAGAPLPDLWKPGEYTLLAYNEPEGIAIERTGRRTETAGAVMVARIADFAAARHLYSGALPVAPRPDDTLRVSIPLTQRTRLLSLALALAPEDSKRLASAEISLTGLTSQMELATGRPLPATATAHLPLHREENMLRADLYLTGIATGHKQLLTLTLHSRDGYTQIVEDDLTDKLREFNNNIQPLILGTHLQLEREGEMDFGITDWMPGLPEGGGEGDAVG